MCWCVFRHICLDRFLLLLFFLRIYGNILSSLQKSEGSSSDHDTDDDCKSSPKNPRFDTVAATFLDVGVLRCLFILHWQEEGIYWCLHYIYNRYRHDLLH